MHSHKRCTNNMHAKEKKVINKASHCNNAPNNTPQSFLLHFLLFSKEGQFFFQNVCEGEFCVLVIIYYRNHHYEATVENVSQ